MTKPPTTHRTPTETDDALARGGNQQAADRAAARVAALDETQPLDVPGGPTGNGAPHSAQADPTPAATPVASASPSPRDGDRAGAGRPHPPAGQRLARLGIPGHQYLAVLHRHHQGRTQRRLNHYLTTARFHGATDREARLVLATVEHMVVVAQPIGRVDPFELAVEVVAHQFNPAGVGAA